MRMQTACFLWEPTRGLLAKGDAIKLFALFIVFAVPFVIQQLC